MNSREYTTLFILLVGLLQTYHAKEIPNCDFEDTVDLTHAHKFANGSYLYGEDVIIAPDQIGIYNYEEIYDGDRLPRNPHPRGCICRRGNGGRSCIKFCCHPTKQLIWNGTRQCRDLYDEPRYDHSIKVILSNGTREWMDIAKEFIVVTGVPCENAYALNPDKNLHEEWGLFENGSLLRYYNLELLGKRDYCMMPIYSEEVRHEGEWVLRPMICPMLQEENLGNRLNNMAKVVSITFITLTILVILVKPEMCNLQENSLICFLISLAIANILLATITISNEQLTNIWCSFMGFSAYFFSMVSMFWLNVIYFDLLKSIHNRENHFMTYLAYGWGIPVALTAILMLIQNSSMIDKFKPGIGVDACWFSDHNQSALLYFYSINIILLCLNVVYYFQAIHKIKLALKHQPTRRDDLVKGADQYGRLLFLMIVLCCFDTVSKIETVVNLGSDSIWLYISDFVCSLQGPIIFWIFAVKPMIEWRHSRIQQNGATYDTLDEGFTLSDVPGSKDEQNSTNYDRF